MAFGDFLTERASSNTSLLPHSIVIDGASDAEKFKDVTKLAECPNELL